MSNPIISKDHFVACMETLREADDMACRINNIMNSKVGVREYDKGPFIEGYSFSNSDCEMKLLETLEIALEDKEHWISWWCLEANYGRESEYVATVVAGDKEFVLDSAEALYDFLTTENLT